MLTLRFPRGLIAALALMACVPSPALAQDADAQEVMRYSLTEAGLAKYSQATRQLAALPSGAPGACGDDGQDSEAQSITAGAAKLDAVPGAKAAVQSAGMNSREYIVFSLSLMQSGLAAWGLSQPGGKLPPGMSKANVDFVQKHDAALKQLGALSKRSDCGGDEEEQDEAEEPQE